MSSMINVQISTSGGIVLPEHVAAAVVAAYLDQHQLVAINRDTGCLRDCDFPLCPAVYDALRGGGIGWLQANGKFWTGTRACPDHAELLRQHRPTAERRHDDLLVVSCGCGVQSEPLAGANSFIARGWWQEHVHRVEYPEVTRG